MFAKVRSVGLFGMCSYMVEVEADVSGGLPRFDIVGLPGTSVSESRERVRSSVKNAGLMFPKSRITVNLAPADKRKDGTCYDLPIFVALMSVTKQLRCDLTNSAFLGELALNGEIRKIKGALPMVIEAQKNGLESIFVPLGNAAESSVVKGINVYAVRSVRELMGHLDGSAPLEKVESGVYEEETLSAESPDFRDVKGQLEAKFALEVAAAGGHNVMMIGPPGSGKSMLAKRLPSILPDMSFEECLETTNIYSVGGVLPENVSLIKSRPFRAPHHTVSVAGLSGGGIFPHPGEISFAHNGVLFLDELPEFSRQALEIMRQPLEDGAISLTRVSGSASFPCSIMLVCAMNPCPCGFFGHPTRKCTCPAGSAGRYLSRVSGPLLDRLDIHIEVPPVNFAEISDSKPAECSADIRLRVNAARLLQKQRFEGTGVSCNARMTAAQTRKFCKAQPEALALLEKAFDRLEMSARAYDKVLRVARTVADLEGSEKIEARHIGRAIQFRSLDRKFWSR